MDMTDREDDTMEQKEGDQPTSQSRGLEQILPLRPPEKNHFY